MTITLSALQKQRYDTAANWTAENPTLLAGEIGVESDTGKIKIGTGATAWTSLSYSGLIPGSGVYPYAQLLMPSGTAGAPSISFDGDGDTGIYRSGANAVAISTNGTGRLFVDSSGRVGVNTASPDTKLDLNGAFFLRPTSESFPSENGGGLRLRSDTSTLELRGLQWTPSVVYYNINYQGLEHYWSVNGSEQMRLDSSGRLGLGTSSPTNTSGLEIQTSSTSAPGLWVQTGGTTSSYPIVDIRNGANVDVFAVKGDGTSYFQGGNVGIGSTAPNTKLEIREDSAGSIVSLLKLNNNAAIASGKGVKIEFGLSDNPAAGARGYIENVVDGSNGTYMAFGVNDGATGTFEAVRIDRNRRLLVGTSTGPAGATVVFSGNAFDGSTGDGRLYLNRGSTPSSGSQLGAVYFSSNNGTNDGASILAVRDGGTWTAGSSHPTLLKFSTTPDSGSSPVERLRINNLGAFKATTTGSVITATNSTHEFTNANTSEEYALRVRHNAATSNIYGFLIEFNAQTPNNTTSHFAIYSDTTNTKFGFRSNGGLANYSGNNVNLSDQREKKNIGNLDSTWDCLKHWELKKFHYNEDSETDDLRYGVIAQQIAEYCPEVISEWVKQQARPAQVDDDGNEIEPAKEEIVRMGVKEQQMMWMAIKALQEAQLRIETLEAEVAALKAS